MKNLTENDIPCKAEPMSLNRHTYSVKILRFPGRPTIAAEFRDTTKGTVCTYFESLSYCTDRCRQPQTYVKPEAAITVFELLMMNGVSLETC